MNWGSLILLAELNGTICYGPVLCVQDADEEGLLEFISDKNPEAFKRSILNCACNLVVGTFIVDDCFIVDD